jgi:carbamate kinase
MDQHFLEGSNFSHEYVFVQKKRRERESETKQFVSCILMKLVERNDPTFNEPEEELICCCDELVLSTSKNECQTFLRRAKQFFSIL